MSDRVSASITIGGRITPKQFDELIDLIDRCGLSTEWDGAEFTADQHVAGGPLWLCAHEVAWGTFNDLEQYCTNERIAYTRWSGSHSGSFGAERIVFDGKKGPLNYGVDDDDQIILDVKTIEQLGTMRRIRAYVKPAEFAVPPLVVAVD